MTSYSQPILSAKSTAESSDPVDVRMSPEMVVGGYHERTKHHFHRSAASPDYMDWATQPNPFRRYVGAEVIHLPLPEAGQSLPYWQLTRLEVSHLHPYQSSRSLSSFDMRCR